MPVIGTLADVEARWKSREVADQVMRSLFRGLKAAAIFLTARVKEALSVPAPRATVKVPWTGKQVVVATTSATPGAPPRKLMGDFRRKITWDQPDQNSARVGTTDVRGRILEIGGEILPKARKALRWVGAVPAGKKWGGVSVFAKRVTIKPHPYLSTTLKRHRDSIARIIGAA